MFERDGIYQARIRTEANRYLWRSLRTRSQSQAISAARRLFHSIEFRQQSGLPLTNRSVNRVIDEYVALRERQQLQGRTSTHMLRQIKRVVKFWREYIGAQSIESVGNKELSGYIEWRKSYYAQFKTLPKNAKLNPTDKTLQWETALGNAADRGTAATAGHVNSVTSSICHAFHEKPRETCVSMTENSAISALGLTSVRPDTLRKRVGGGPRLLGTPYSRSSGLNRWPYGECRLM